MEALPWRNPNPIEPTLSTCRLHGCEYDSDCELCPECEEAAQADDFDINNQLQAGIDGRGR